MDTFAAIALSTEPPMEKILRTPPTSNASILTAPIWRQVLGVSLWQFIIILTLYLFGSMVGGFEYTHMKLWGDPLDTKLPRKECHDVTTPGVIKGIIDSNPTLAEECATYWGA
jgi:magnesium-transporting ATPase (P-type)